MDDRPAENHFYCRQFKPNTSQIKKNENKKKTSGEQEPNKWFSSTQPHDDGTALDISTELTMYISVPSVAYVYTVPFPLPLHITSYTTSTRTHSFECNKLARAPMKEKINTFCVAESYLIYIWLLYTFKMK